MVLRQIFISFHLYNDDHEEHEDSLACKDERPCWLGLAVQMMEITGNVFDIVYMYILASL